MAAELPGGQAGRPRQCVLIVVKQPVAGQVKTRLAAGVGAARALALYEAFVADTVRTVRQLVDVTCALACWPPTAQPYFAQRYPACWILPQQGRDLGERLSNAFEQVHAAGYGRCVIIGSDSPTVPASYVAQAFVDLAQVPAVLGPSEDGGYYLIGLRAPVPLLFEEITWSTDQVYHETLRQAAKAGLAVATLPTWYDIDTVADLPRLRADLAAATDGHERATWQVLQGMDSGNP